MDCHHTKGEKTMKLKRFVIFAVIGLLVVGALGFTGLKVFAQAPQPAAQSQDCTNQDNDTIQDAGSDADNVDLQCGDQNTADTEDGAEVIGPDTDNVEEQVGDQNTPDTGEETEIAGEQDAAPTGTPAITAEAAQQTAEAYLNAGTATQVELDDEDGALVYSVEFANGTDVKVDAMTGAVLGVETGQD
jgi:uncharacterized membrane protein YkoI